MPGQSRDHLARRIRASLRDDRTPLWLPELAPALAVEGWRTAAGGLTPSTYTTAQFLAHGRAARADAVTMAAEESTGLRAEAIRLEVLPPELAAVYEATGVRFLEIDGSGRGSAVLQVERALAVLDAVPTVLPTVRSLVRSLLLLDAGDDETDVSFSEPSIPFSVFVSVPRAMRADGPARVAEALLHEAMHLQLSLVESVVPLVREDAGTYYSPWRDEHRTVQGVLHALYVFRVIDDFLAALPAEIPWVPDVAGVAEGRRATIAAQVAQVAEFPQTAGLTPDGSAFAARLVGSAAC